MMKKILFSINILLTIIFTHAQNGLENIIVEKYYVSNAADATVNNGIAAVAGSLPVGSVTWRVYADMLPGYKLKAVYGTTAHKLEIKTTTNFFNNEDRGALTANGIAAAQLRNNTVGLDSYLSVGAAGSGNNYGVLKPTDNGLANLYNLASNPAMKNVDPSAGLALTAQDGIIAGTVAPEALTFVGLSNGVANELDVFDNASVGGLFQTNNGSIEAANGASGPVAADNRVLIGQFTTDGIFEYSLNIKLETPTGGTELYVANNPTSGEISIPSLSNIMSPPPVRPIVLIFEPQIGSNYAVGDTVYINASANNNVANIAYVEFFVNNTSIGLDSTPPYSIAYLATAGPLVRNIKARGVSNLGFVGPFTSLIIPVNVASDPFPIVNITSPIAGSTYITGSPILITANATDNGSIVSVEFFVDGFSIAVDNTAPYSAVFNGYFGTRNFTAKAIDNLGLPTISPGVLVSVFNNVSPIVNITSPVSGTSILVGDTTVISASASDADGSIKFVEFFVNGVFISIDTTAPYTAKYSGPLGTYNITARATDNIGMKIVSAPISINFVNVPVSISSPLPSASISAPDVVVIAANVLDPTGKIVNVEFFINGTSIGIDTLFPYSIPWTSVAGSKTITARTTDNLGIQNNSSPIIITIQDRCASNFNADQVIDTQDFLIFIGLFNQSCTNCVQDLNRDGLVNIQDFLILISNFNRVCP